MGFLRNRNMLRLMDYQFLIGITLLAVLFLMYENSTHNISLEDCDQCKGE
jgi:hypothetical protein